MITCQIWRHLTKLTNKPRLCVVGPWGLHTGFLIGAFSCLSVFLQNGISGKLSKTYVKI